MPTCSPHGRPAGDGHLYHRHRRQRNQYHELPAGQAPDERPDTKASEAERKSIALVNKEDYLVLAATMGSDIALNKKILAGNEILKFIRRGELLSVAHLHGFDAEVVELVAAPDSPITRGPCPSWTRPFTARSSSAPSCATGSGRSPWATPTSSPTSG
jgi:hypothetical protein